MPVLGDRTGLHLQLLQRAVEARKLLIMTRREL